MKMRKGQKRVNGGIMVKDDQLIELQPNIFWLKGEDTSSHSYLIRGGYKNVLIDSGVDKNFFKLQQSFFEM